MENLVAEQLKTAEAIKRAHINMKKDSPSRKTKEYCDRKMAQLNEEWDNFKETHQKLQELPKTHEYHAKDVYGQAEKIYQQAIAHLEKIEQKLQEDGLTTEGNAHKPLITDSQIIKEQMSSIQLFLKDLNKINNLLEDESHYELLKVKQQNMERRWSEIVSLEIKINALGTEDAELYSKNGYFDEANEKYEETQAKLITTIRRENSAGSSKINLPTTTIPTFTGLYDSWPNFRDIFKQLVDNNSSFGGVEKMQLLKTNLRGEPARIIQHLEISSSNYQTAWKLIEERYNNPRMLFNKHMDHLLNFTNLNSESAGAMKKLHDTIRESTEALRNMNINKWEDIIAYIMLRKLDSTTANLYEQSVNKPRDIQHLDDLISFLAQRFQTLEVVRTNTKKPERKYDEHQKINSHLQRTTKCSICNNLHEIYRCEKFKNLSLAEREAHINQKQLCRNCLSHHFKQICHCRSRCQKCNGRHHTMLHREKRNDDTKRPHPSNPTQERVNSHLGHAKNNLQESKTSVLATALIRATNKNDEKITLRALIDPGSQASFITTAAAQALGKQKIKQNAEITGLGNTATESRWKINTNITPNFDSEFAMDAELNVIGKVTNNMPSTHLYTKINWDNIQLADPLFHVPGPIDVLLGIDYFPKYMKSGFKATEDGLVAQNTHFGWIISGTASSSLQFRVASLITNLNENSQLTKFWNIEEAENSEETTNDDTFVEEFYSNTFRRDEHGYTVKLPFKKSKTQLGESKQRALARLFHLENKLDKDEKLRTMYKEFMQEYIALGHMKIASSNNSAKRYYIPHQPVLKEERDTTKLRVVFDASAKTSTGLSLNDILHTGPKLQQDLIDILIRWRKHKIAITADIEKMYRQVKLDRENQPLHSILWRNTKDEPIQTYELTTVTYGTAPAAYLAIRTMRQLATDEKKNHPLAAEIVLRDFYVDDLLSGADTIEEARHIQKEVTDLLKKGGFNIRKWKYNVLTESKSTATLDDKNGPTKTLGITWTPREDNIQYLIKRNSEHRLTKRKILSEIATIFDPLGLLSPVIIQAKLLMQEIWKTNTSWDEPPPEHIRNTWKNFRNELPKLEEIQVQRWIHLRRGQPLEIHGFSDASLKAYGAAVYIKTTDTNGNTHVGLLASKSKVSPLKNTKTIPQLKLCAALLLAKLIKRCVTALNHNNSKIFTWSDSQVVISWINADAGKWKMFVANRVREIPNLLGQGHWYYYRRKQYHLHSAINSSRNIVIIIVIVLLIVYFLKYRKQQQTATDAHASNRPVHPEEIELQPIYNDSRPGSQLQG
ncbi:uncharacterized protein LOC123312983 [Coccinella septempunctata]|uniref:uncharacterized protein LOC123312983 n=1 Tax=Coccinella septempunctata TaxID=41139 RepID=UPI001D05E783|nr:uncharacterized protein LOC123312983 [Coccinella septempunctata]